MPYYTKNSPAKPVKRVKQDKPKKKSKGNPMAKAVGNATKKVGY